MMRYRSLGNTGLKVSEIAFGAGPVSGLMTDSDSDLQGTVVSRALSLGINWFDTAPGYGAGRSEAGLGEALAKCDTSELFHVATKVRLRVQDECDLRPMVMESVRQSLGRLRMGHVTLLQLHNSITEQRGDEPTSLTVEDVLGPKGVLSAFEELRAAGCVDHFGLTGIGQADALCQVIRSGRFSTIQAPFHLLNPSALNPVPWMFAEPDYCGFLRVAHDMGMGIFAIRAFAAGALLGSPPSKHTLTTPFFPLALYERDLARANYLIDRLGSVDALRELALRYALSQPEFSAVILGFGLPGHVDEAVRIDGSGPLDQEEWKRLRELMMELKMSTDQLNHNPD